MNFQNDSGFQSLNLKNNNKIKVLEKNRLNQEDLNIDLWINRTGTIFIVPELNRIQTSVVIGVYAFSQETKKEPFWKK